MLIIACYDVCTETSAGRSRLRRVAKACEAVGQRVQKSVFEFQIDAMQFEALEGKLLDIIDLDTDCLRFYRLPGSSTLNVKHGHFRALDFDGPLVV